MAKSTAKKAPEQTEARRLEVREFMETIGPFSVPAKALAEKHDVTVKVIYNDIQLIIKQLDLKHMDVQGRKILMSLMKNMSIAEELKAKGTPGERLKAVQACNQTADVITRMMENYGFKEKIADNLNITAQETVFNLIVKSAEEIKDGKLNNQPKTA